jgi:putative endonuclease
MPEHEELQSEAKWSVYVLRCSDDSYYVGVARDVLHRVRQHDSGQGPLYTKRRRPVKLVYAKNASPS